MLNSGADVLILNHYGNDMVNSLTQAVQFGLRDKQVNGKKFEIVVPLFSELMAKGAGDAIKGIYGTANWDWKLRGRRHQGLHQVVRRRSTACRRRRPRRPATCRRCSMPTPCERAGTFYPPEVIKALEGFEFDGMGNGPTLYRAEDHQCFKDVLVVQGKEDPTDKFDLLEVVEDRAARGSDLRRHRSSAATSDRPTPSSADRLTA